MPYGLAPPRPSGTRGRPRRKGDRLGAPGRVILARSDAGLLALVTTDLAASPAALITRYAARWSIEPSNATGKQLTGADDACNRTEKAVERTVPVRRPARTASGRRRR